MRSAHTGLSLVREAMLAWGLDVSLCHVCTSPIHGLCPVSAWLSASPLAGTVEGCIPKADRRGLLGSHRDQTILAGLHFALLTRWCPARPSPQPGEEDRGNPGCLQPSLTIVLLHTRSPRTTAYEAGNSRLDVSILGRPH